MVFLNVNPDFGGKIYYKYGRGMPFWSISILKLGFQMKFVRLLKYKTMTFEKNEFNVKFENLFFFGCSDPLKKSLLQNK